MNSPGNSFEIPSWISHGIPSGFCQRLLFLEFRLELFLSGSCTVFFRIRIFPGFIKDCSRDFFNDSSWVYFRDSFTDHSLPQESGFLWISGLLLNISHEVPSGIPSKSCLLILARFSLDIPPEIHSGIISRIFLGPVGFFFWISSEISSLRSLMIPLGRLGFLLDTFRDSFRNFSVIPSSIHSACLLRTYPGVFLGFLPRFFLWSFKDSFLKAFLWRLLTRFSGIPSKFLRRFLQGFYPGFLNWFLLGFLQKILQ